MGQWQVQPSPGGLVTALAPILSERGGLWIGWPGMLEKVDFDELLAAEAAQERAVWKTTCLSFAPDT